MTNSSSEPNPALGCVILIAGALVLGLVSFPAVGGILIGGGVMLGVIWGVFHLINGGN